MGASLTDKQEEYALYQSEYFMRINEYMKQQLGQILEEAKAAENHEDVEEVNIDSGIRAYKEIRDKYADIDNCFLVYQWCSYLLA